MMTSILMFSFMMAFQANQDAKDVAAEARVDRVTLFY